MVSEVEEVKFRLVTRVGFLWVLSAPPKLGGVASSTFGSCNAKGTERVRETVSCSTGTIIFKLPDDLRHRKCDDGMSTSSSRLTC